MFTRPFISIALAFLTIFSFAQNVSFPENENKEGLHLISSKQESIQLSYHIHQFELTPTLIQGESMMALQHGFNLIPNKAGAPDLPFVGGNFLIPDGATIELVITSADKEVYNDVSIAPSAPIPFETEMAIPAEKGSEYTIDSFFPSQSIEVKYTEVRGMQIASIGVSPFQYNPVTKELIAYKNIEFELKISNSKGTYGEERFRSPFWDQILADLVINSDDIPVIDYNKRSKQSKDLGCEYLIVVPNNDDFLVWADSIKKFRNEQGIHTKVVTINDVGGNDVGIIDDYFEDVYSNWDPVPSAVLLMADYGTDENTITSKERDHPNEGVYISDNDYADITGNNLPDFVFARMTGRNFDEFEVMVNKFRIYETNPPTAESFYNEPITALGWQTERWFQICSESIGGYMTNNLGKSPNRINKIYDGNPNVDPWSTANNTYAVTNYFGPNGLGYIPQTPQELGDWNSGNANDVVNGINSGCFILQHRDHGFYGGWGEPSFHTSDIDQLTNADLLTHVFTINCQTGQFDVGSNSMAEKFHRLPNGGAVSVTAPTQVSYSFVNDTYVWGMYDNMWPDFMPAYGGNWVEERDFRPAFGSASGKYFLYGSTWANQGMTTITYRLFHHHGDAFNIIYTEVPQENEIAHVDGITNEVTSLNIEAAPGSFVGLSIDGEYMTYGICDLTGIANIEIPAQNPSTVIKVVVTKQNYFRYEGQILVVPAEGPYVIETTHEINDMNANNNGFIEFNEDIYLDYTIKNVGMDVAENVVISINSSDEYIQILDGSEDIGTVEPGQEVSVEQAFSFAVSVDIPDEHMINITFSATNGTDIWESQYGLVAYAPNLEFTFIDFEEIEGNGNGFLDAGETATASFQTTNTGSRDFPAGEQILSTNSSYITIESDNTTFDDITTDETFITEFEITASESTPLYTSVSIINQLNAAPFDIYKELFFSIGIIVEDWEQENFSTFNWISEGDKEWEIVDDYVEEGDFSAKIVDLNDNEYASLSLEYEVLADHEISFYMQVSSEEGHDFLNFYIDDVIQDSWSGLVLFEQFSFPVDEGTHIFKWEYAKDNEGSSGMDAAWLDFIILPPGNILINTENIESETIDISIYPNPANDFINIVSHNDEAIGYQIINSTGQTVYTSVVSKNDNVDISNFKAGLYIIKFDNTKNGTKSSRFLKL